tara:strand:+ start:2151 stop:3095 length:945 start_codon:yes stop_codon:yes gene_type:complete
MVNVKTNRNKNNVYITNHPPVEEASTTIEVSNFPADPTSIEVSNFPAHPTTIEVSNFDYPSSIEVSNFPAHPTTIEVSNFPAHPTSIEVSNLITGKSETTTTAINQNLMYGMRPDLSTLQTLSVDNSGKLKIYNSVSTGGLDDVMPNTDNFTRQAIFANDGTDVRIVKCDTDGNLIVKDMDLVLESLERQQKPIKLWSNSTHRTIFNNITVSSGGTDGWNAFDTRDISFLQPFGKLLLASTNLQYASANVRIEVEVNQGGSTWWAHPTSHIIYVNPYGGFDCPPINNFGFDDIRFRAYNDDSQAVVFSFLMRVY